MKPKFYKFCATILSLTTLKLNVEQSGVGSGRRAGC